MRILVVTIAVASAAVLIMPGCPSPSAVSADEVEDPGDNVVRPNPRELGWVAWGRDYDRAAAASKRTGKPIFLLFQEVPGCSTCVGFGESVLAHPLMIETIETAFIPVAIYNNKRGKDAEILKKFSEPSWNNPVVRFVDGAGRDLVKRADGVWSTAGIAERMVAALTAAKRPVPDHLRWVVEETTARASKATFSMYCYWSGEACLGDIDGVLSTRAGWHKGREVVEVVFDRAKISKNRLRSLADERGCGEFVAKPGRVSNAKASHRKYHLQRSTWNYVPLTPRQASRVNAAVQSRKDPLAWVSPRQRALHDQITRALARNKSGLSGLRRPDDVNKLARYEAKLRARLDRVLGDGS